VEVKMTKKVTILRGADAPTIIPIGEMNLSMLGVEGMMEWVKEHRPECVPEGVDDGMALFPHGGIDEATGRELTANELLVELAGRKCYDSFGDKAGRKSNAEYIANTQQGDIPHASILYHAKMSFFFAGISRRVSHEIIRNYVGADRSEEGAPSQESTRFTHHYGYFIEPPKYTSLAFDYADEKHQEWMRLHFERSMQGAFDNYILAVEEECAAFEVLHKKKATSLDKKRIYEAASSFLPHQAETSFIWTTNPAAIMKFVKERDNIHADLEIQRFAHKWRRICGDRWPNIFPSGWGNKE
jgi:thymidylate synthase (FAD)